MRNLNFQVPEARSVLVLAPHPDDEALGCGGTVALYRQTGIQVYLAVVTDGSGIAEECRMSRGEVIAVRKEETRKASGVLGISDVFFLDLPDGELRSCRDRVLAGISAVAGKVRPDIVFSPSPVDYHEDHIAVADAAMRLLQNGIVSRIAFYEVYESVRFNTLVDISASLDVKRRAVFEYKNSLFGAPDLFFDAISGMNRSRALYTRQQKGIYEAFWIVSTPLSRNEMLRYLTYGLGPDDPATLFLGKLQAVDEMLHALRNSRQELTAKEGELIELRRNLERAESEGQELKGRLDSLSSGIAWKIVSGYYRMRDRMFPHQSSRRRLYERITGIFKK